MVIALLALCALQDEAPDYFPLKIGNEWRFKGDEGEIIWTIEKAEKVGDTEGLVMKTVSKIGDQQKTVRTWITAGKEGVAVHKTDEEEVKPCQPWIKFPLKKGEKWTSKYKGGTSSFQVGAEADLRVPAGKFKCFPVSESFRGKRTYTITYWFAKDTGPVRVRWVEAGMQLDFNLVKFTPGK